MKKLIFALMICLLSICIFACGTEQKEAVKERNVDVGKFCVTVPAGWYGCPMTEDLNTSYAEDEDAELSDSSYGIIKNGRSENDIYTKPTICIKLLQGDIEEGLSASEYCLDELETMELKDKGIVVYRTEDEKSEVINKDYAYESVFLPCGKDGYFQVRIPLTEGISSSDEDVQTIIASLSLNVES